MAPAKKAKAAKPAVKPAVKSAAAKTKANKPANKLATKAKGKSVSSASPLKKVADLAKNVAKTLRDSATSAAKAAPVAAATPKSVKATSAAAPVSQVGAGKKSAQRKGAALTSLRSASVDPESVCREVACEGLATSAGYCRLHYIKNWTKIKRKEVILREKKLNQYIEELVAKYPDKYLEAIRQDLASDKDFAKVIHDLDLDESVDDFEAEGESMEAIVGDIKRDFDDEGEGF